MRRVLLAVFVGLGVCAVAWLAGVDIERGPRLAEVAIGVFAASGLAYIFSDFD